MKSNQSSQLDPTFAFRRQLRPGGINGRLARPNVNRLSFSSLIAPSGSSATPFWDPQVLDRLKVPLSRYHY